MAAIRPCTGTTADWKAVEDTLILKEREIGVEIDTSGHYQIRQGDTEFVDAHALTVAVKRLRDKLEDDTQKPEYVKTVYGIGYTWAVNG